VEEPEDDFGREVGPFLDDEELGDRKDVPGRKAPERKLKRRGELRVDGSEYRGKKTTRKRAFDQHRGGSDTEEEETDDELRQENTSNSQGDGSASLDLTESSDSENDGATGDSLSEDSIEDRLGNMVHQTKGKAVQELVDEYEKLQEEEADALAHIKQQERKNKDRASAIRNQQSIWENALEFRMMLQNLLGIANKAPRPDVYPTVLSQSIEARTGYSAVTKAACNALDALLGLTFELASNNPDIRDSAAVPGQFQDLSLLLSSGQELGKHEDLTDAYWEKLKAVEATFSGYGDESIDAWHRKTSITTGTTAKSMQVLNQPVSKQVKDLLHNPARMMKKAHLPLSSVGRVLCQTPPAAKEQSAPFDDPGALLEEACDFETYDDTDFYQQLLKEFLENAADGGLGKVAPVRPAKRRKLVDRRASKGRKIRYQVQEPLVNFMAPVDMPMPGIASNLFTALFGIEKADQ